jgi:hypothetical protein
VILDWLVREHFLFFDLLLLPCALALLAVDANTITLESGEFFMVRSRVRQKSRGFESLEARAMMAGDVTITQVGTVLNITGDAAANILTIEPGPGGAVRVTGTGTTLNTAPGPNDYFGITDIVANLGAGADQITVQDLGALVNLTINGEADADIITVDSVGVSSVTTLNGGTGSDTINFIDSTAVTLTVTGDAGVDTINLTNSTVTTLSVSGGLDNDDINITGLTNTVASTLTISGDDGNDTIDFLNAVGTLASPLTINGNAGNDTLRVNNATLATLNINGGAGDDTIIAGIDFQPNITTVAGQNAAIAAGTLTVNAALNINGDAGSDTITAYRVFGTANWTVNTGSASNLAGNTDTFTTYWTFSNQLTVTGGVGVDRLNIFYHTASGATNLNAGAGNDFVQVVISRFIASATFNVEAGADVLAIDTNQFDADLVMDGGLDADYLLLAASVLEANATIFGGDGNDYLLIGKHADGSVGGNLIEDGLLQVLTGAGDDYLDIQYNALRQLYASLGDGNDTVVTGGNQIAVASFMDGGAGNNRITRTGNQNVTYYNFAN